MLFSTSLQQLEFHHAEEFCRTWVEGIRVEYKRELRKSHIPKVATSFANTSGGVWIVGVETDNNNRPIFPIKGMPFEVGLEERITQTCYQNIYPPLLPEIKIIELPNNSGNIVVIIRVQESFEAPHSIENTTKVYIRTNSTTEIVQLSEIDRIDYLLQRRRGLEGKRREIFEKMDKRSKVAMPLLCITISPRYPYKPIHSGDSLAQGLQNLGSDPDYSYICEHLRRIQQGLISAPSVSSSSPHTNHHFEANFFGMLFHSENLWVESKVIALTHIVIVIGRIFKLTKYLLGETATNLAIQVRIQGAFNHVISPDGTLNYADSRWRNRHRSVEKEIEAEVETDLDVLSDELNFIDQVTEVVRQLMWSFDWADRAKITSRTHEILRANHLP